MSGQAILVGVLLAIVSAITVGISEKFSPTALIPAGEGVLLIIFGLVARNPKARMHAMHGAALVGLIGAAMAGVILIRSISKAAGGEAVPMSKWVSLGGMTVLSIVFVVMCVNSFIAARRARKAGESAA